MRKFFVSILLAIVVALPHIAQANVKPENVALFPFANGTQVDNSGSNDDLQDNFSTARDGKEEESNTISPAPGKQIINVTQRLQRTSPSSPDRPDPTRKLQFKLTGFTSFSKAKKLFTLSGKSDAFIFESNVDGYYLAAFNRCVLGCGNHKYRVVLYKGVAPEGSVVKDTTGDSGFLNDDEVPRAIEKWLDKNMHADDTYGGVRIDNKEALVAAGLKEYEDSFTEDLVGNAISGVLVKLKEITADVIAKSQGIVMASGIIDQDSLGKNDALISSWTLARDIANIFFLIILLVIAFTNVSRFGIEYYTMRSLLPKFAAAVVLVNLSFFICRFIIDAANVLTQGFSSLEAANKVFSAAQNFDPSAGDVGVGVLAVGAWVLVMILALLAALLLWALMVVRILVIWFLIIVAPLAFIANVLPATQSFTRGWWSQFIKFALIAPAVALILKLGAVFSDASVKIDDSGDLLLTPMFAAMTLMIAATVPVLLGGKIMATASGVVMGAMGRGAKMTRPYATDALGKVPLLGSGSRLNFNRNGDPRGLAATRAGRFLGVGRLGTNKARYDRGMAAADKMDMNKYGNGELQMLMQTRGKTHPLGMAAARELASRGSLSTDPGGAVTSRQQGLFDKYSTDSKFVMEARKNQPQFLLANRRTRALGESGIRNAGVAAQAGWGGSIWGENSPLWTYTDGSGNHLYNNWSEQVAIAGMYGRESNEKVRKGYMRNIHRFSPEMQTVIQDYVDGQPGGAHPGVFRYAPEHPENVGLAPAAPPPPPPPPPRRGRFRIFPGGPRPQPEFDAGGRGGPLPGTPPPTTDTPFARRFEELRSQGVDAGRAYDQASAAHPVAPPPAPAVQPTPVAGPTIPRPTASAPQSAPVTATTSESTPAVPAPTASAQTSKTPQAAESSGFTAPAPTPAAAPTTAAALSSQSRQAASRIASTARAGGQRFVDARPQIEATLSGRPDWEQLPPASRQAELQRIWRGGK